MDNEIVTRLTRIETRLENNTEDIKDIKNDIKGLKDCYPSRESFNQLEERVEKLEYNSSKIIWLVLTAVISAILNLVIK